MARLVFPIVSLLLLGAHFMRAGNTGPMVLCIALLPLMFSRRSWVPPVFRGLLVIAAVVWVDAMLDLIRLRQMLGLPWIRMAVILSGVTGVTLASSWPFHTRWSRRRYSDHPEAEIPGAVTFFLTATLLFIVHVRAPFPLLLPERFFAGGEWLAIVPLALYAAWIAEKMLDPKSQPTWRLRIWILFSLVFFSQLVLGLVGFERLLMTGDLHLPVPALIAAGPLFRGEGFFMPVLFGVTLLLVGPAWCSHLCYIGAWDNAAAVGRGRPTPLPAWAKRARPTILLCVMVTAVLFRLLGVSTATAAVAALAFGAIGVMCMVFLSRKLGVMTHCTVYCPIGLFADILGRINPFRIRLQAGCTQCGKCSRACRFDALHTSDIERRRPGLTCTLCGDCVGQCKEGQILYQLGSQNAPWVRTAFIVLVASIHAVFLGVARM